MLTRLRDRRSTTLGAGRASKKGVPWGEGRGGLPGTGPGVVVRGRRRRRRRTGLGGAESEQGKSFPTPTPPRAAPVLVGVQVRNWPRPLKHLPCSLLVKRVLSLSDLFVNVVDCVGHHVRSGNKSKRLINTFCLWKKKKRYGMRRWGRAGREVQRGEQRAARGAAEGPQARLTLRTRNGAGGPQRGRGAEPPAPGCVVGAKTAAAEWEGESGPAARSRRKTSSGSTPRSRSLSLCFPSSLSLPLESHQACNQQQKLT